MIRNDYIVEFVKYVTSIEKCPLNRLLIKGSIYETNQILLNNIDVFQYSFFYGSMKILNYLYAKVKNLKIQWIAIHSNKPATIHFLEDKHNQSQILNDHYFFTELIKFFHNEITDYLVYLF